MIRPVLALDFNPTCANKVSEITELSTTTKTYNTGMYAMGIISSIHLFFISKFMESDFKDSLNDYIISSILGTANSSFMLMGAYFPTSEKIYKTVFSFLGGMQNLFLMLSWLGCNNRQREKLICYSLGLGVLNSVLAIPYASYKQFIA